MFRSIRWRIALPNVAVILLLATAFTVYFSSFMRAEYLESLEARLVDEVKLVAEVVRPLLPAEAPELTVQPVVERLGGILNARVTVVRADGVVLGDTHEDPAVMNNHLQRPEIQAALADGFGLNSRYSSTLGYRLMYAAVPVEAGGTVVAIARVSLPVEDIEGRIARMRHTIAVVSVAVAFLAGLSVLVSARSVTQPLRRLSALAERMARGDMTGRIRVSSRDEVGRLAGAFNKMAAELDEQLGTLADQRNTLQAVLNIMADGVVITGEDERVKLINPAAARLLGVSLDEAMGSRFVVVARDHQVVEVWRRCGQTGEEQSETVEMTGNRPFLHVVVTPLGVSGRLILLQDLTRIRRLETVRRDFISNISHELRTPLASLRALVETLQGGAFDDPPAARRFVGMIDTEVDALTQMVEELLELSRIESGQVPLRLVPTPVDELIDQPLERLRPQARRARISLAVELPEDLPLALADVERARQVVTNLVHNAIKFTPKGGRVVISASEAEGEVVVSVQDTGVGIPAADLDRIFERFYKADQARSGGGTGLGLAIARHIVQAHDGRIWAESTLGGGSTFYFTLPVATD